MKNATDPRQRTYSADDVRQGEIILKKPWQRAVFIAGLAGGVVLMVVLHIVGAI